MPTVSYVNGTVRICLLRSRPDLTVEDYAAAVATMSPEELAAELASARRQFEPARLNALSREMRDDFAAKFDALVGHVKASA